MSPKRAKRTPAKIKAGWEAYWYRLTDHLNAPDKVALPDSVRDGSTVTITGRDNEYGEIEGSDGRTATIPLEYLEEAINQVDVD